MKNKPSFVYLWHCVCNLFSIKFPFTVDKSPLGNVRRVIRLNVACAKMLLSLNKTTGECSSGAKHQNGALHVQLQSSVLPSPRNLESKGRSVSAVSLCSVRACLSVCLSLPVSFCLTVCLSLSLSVSMSISLSLLFFFSLPASLSHSKKLPKSWRNWTFNTGHFTPPVFWPWHLWNSSVKSLHHFSDQNIGLAGPDVYRCYE